MTEHNATSVTALTGPPLFGQDLANVSVLRLDRLGGPAPGNKVFKLRAFLDEAAAAGNRRLLSFGGAWSNHLHALAGLGAACGIETVGIVPLSRADYRQREDTVFQQRLLDRHGPGLLIAEGGASAVGIRGCLALAQRVNSTPGPWDRVVLAVGTGTTLDRIVDLGEVVAVDLEHVPVVALETGAGVFDGLAAGLAPGTKLVGVSALKNARDLERRVEEGLVTAGLQAAVPWEILHSYHCGGFARADARLRALMLDFEASRCVQLEPVYTGKALLAIHDQLERGLWHRNERILLIHTGGLQGRRGFAWLRPG